MSAYGGVMSARLREQEHDVEPEYISDGARVVPITEMSDLIEG